MSSHHRRVQERLVALQVADPQLIGRIAGLLAVHHVTGGALVGDLAPAGPPRQPADAVAEHHQLNDPTRHDDASPLGQLGVDASGAVGAPRGVIDLPDDLPSVDVPESRLNRPRKTRGRPSPSGVTDGTG